jgi:hypothetical protein
MSHYNECYISYSTVAKKLIGRDTQIIREEGVRTRHPRFYASHFHDILISRLLYTARSVEHCACDLKGFHRQLSYIESTLPVLVLTRKPKFQNRLFVFDRADANQPWYLPPLSSVKSTNLFYIISAQTIRDKSGIPLRIFNKAEIVNISDDVITLDKKLALMDVPTLQIMCGLLNINAQIERNFSIPTIENLCVYAKKIVLALEEKYKF